MILVLRKGTGQQQIEDILARLQTMGASARLLQAEGRTLVHVIRNAGLAHRLENLQQVETILPADGPTLRLRGRRFYPYHLVNWIAAGLFLLGALVLLAGVLPPGLGSNVDLAHPPSGLGPPWYFRGLDQFLNLFSSDQTWLSWPLVLLIWALLFFVPVLHRSRGVSLRERWLAVVFGLMVALGMLYLSLRGLLL